MQRQSGLRWPEYLAVRVAAKHAVRSVLRDLGVALPEPAGIEVVKNAEGCPRAVLLDRPTNGPRELPLSLSHSEGVAGALCTPPGWAPGLDVQGHAERDLAFMYRAMGPHDLEVLGRLVGLPPTRPQELPARSVQGRALLRLWCAKEAAAKALGRGLVPAPSAYELRSLSPAGTLHIHCPGLPEEVAVHTALVGTFGWGVSLLPVRRLPAAH